MAESQMVDNQYKLLLTLFTIGNSSVSGERNGLVQACLNLVSRCES